MSKPILSKAQVIKALRRALTETPTKAKEVPLPRDVVVASLQITEEFQRRTNASDAREEAMQAVRGAQ